LGVRGDLRTLRLAFALRFILYTLSIALAAGLFFTTLADPAAFDIAIVPLAIFTG
jgi:hypothetical protein